MIIFGRNISNIEIEPQDSSVHSFGLMSHHYVQLDFNLDEEILITKGSYVQHEGFTFKVYDTVVPTQSDSGYNYSVLFKDPNYAELDRFCIFYSENGIDESTFRIATNLATHAQLIADCLNANLNTTDWTVSVDASLNVGFKEVSYDGGYLVDELNNIATIFECEWWIADNIIHLGQLTLGTEVDFREGEIVGSMTTETGDTTSSGTRVFAYGSTKNLTSDYGQATQGGATNLISEVRLRLPDGQKYIDAWSDMDNEDIVHKRVIFDDIYPKNTDTITSIEEVERDVDDSDDTFTAYIAVATDSNVSEDDVIEKSDMTIYFTSGVLAGWSFSIDESSDLDNHKYEIVATHEDDGNGGLITIPNETLKPSVGDTFVVEGVMLPDENILEAELELQAATEEWIVKYANTDTHSVTVDAVYCSDNNLDFQLGQKVKLFSLSLRGGERSSRIIGFDKPLYCKYAAVYSIGDNTSYSSRLSALESGLEETKYTQRFGVSSSNGFYIITSYDSTQATDLNVFSASHVLTKYTRYGKDANFANVIVKNGLVVSMDGESYLETLSDYIAFDKSFGSRGASGGLLGSGFLWDKENETLSVPKLEVQKKATFNILEVKKTTSIGGQQITSHGNAIISKVTDGGTYYRCDIETDDDSIGIDYTVGSLVRMQDFKPTGSRYYWRAVTTVGDGYFNLSKTNCDDGSDAPMAGDQTVALGHLTDTTRQSAILQSAVGAANPSIRYYSGIDSFSLDTNTSEERCLMGGSGNISDITDPVLGKLSDNALYHRDAYLTGKFILKSSGEDVEQKFSLVEGQLVSEIASVKTYADDAVDALEIGGVNLLIRHDETVGSIVSNLSQGEISPGFPLSALSNHSITVVAGESYIFSKTSNGTSDNYWRYKWLDSSGSFLARAANNSDLFKWVAPVNATSIVVSYPKDENVKIEKGNVVTAYSPAPEDLTANTDAVKSELQTSITQLDDELALKASQSDYNALGERVATSEAELILQDDLIQSKVADGDLVSLINQRAGSLDLRAATINLDGVVTFNNINNIGGGNNLILDPNFTSQDFWTTRGPFNFVPMVISDGIVSNNCAYQGVADYGWFTSKQTYPCTAGDQYKFGAWFRRSTNSTRCVYFNVNLYDSNSDYTTYKYKSLDAELPKDNEWHYMEWTYTVPADTYSIGFGVALNHNGGTEGWMLCQGFSVVKVLEASDLGATIIEGGYIKTDLINAKEITALGSITAGNFNLGSGQFVVDSAGNLIAKNALITGKLLSPFATITYDGMTLPNNSSTISLPVNTSKVYFDYTGVASSTMYLPRLSSNDGLELMLIVKTSGAGTLTPIMNIKQTSGYSFYTENGYETTLITSGQNVIKVYNLVYCAAMSRWILNSSF